MQCTKAIEINDRDYLTLDMNEALIAHPPQRAINMDNRPGSGSPAGGAFSFIGGSRSSTRARQRIWQPSSRECASTVLRHNSPRNG